ncbi:MAG TPA: DUF5985 family protein [Candidatus Tectomicrobia bacterium]|nr:DUF5985 family protein [Candidatus Tectomicrobia bacterium]
MDLFLLGATTMANAVAGLLFLRMWRESRDRLYVLFAGAFWLEAVARAGLLLTSDPSEADPARYLLRVVAYGMIIGAIIDKNIGRRGPRRDRAM